MKKMPAGEFKTHCLSIMDDVQATGEPVLITKRGTPVVKVMPVEQDSDVFGFMAREFDIVGDVESPTVPLNYWKVTGR